MYDRKSGSINIPAPPLKVRAELNTNANVTHLFSWITIIQLEISTFSAHFSAHFVVCLLTPTTCFLVRFQHRHCMRASTPARTYLKRGVGQRSAEGHEHRGKKPKQDGKLPRVGTCISIG